MEWKNFINKRNKIDGLDLLSSIPDDMLTVVFFDPQYRGVLDKLSYGNEGKSRGKDRCDLTQMPEDIIKKFFTLIERKLKPDGYLFLWVDKFHLVTGILPWFEHTPSLSPVDLITWNKKKIGMGYRTRRICEYLIVLQKTPRHAKATWTIHNIPDVWDEKITNKIHTHQKPIELQKQLLLATTKEGDLVCDPSSGSYSVFKCCKLIGRDFIGGDIEFGDNKDIPMSELEMYMTDVKKDEVLEPVENSLF